MTRTHLSPRQVQTLEGLIEAAVAEIGEHGYADFSVRGVARRAGVAPATAYTYFASKDHLVAEVFWRRFRAQPDDLAATGPLDRTVEVLESFGLIVADETELAAACTIAVLSHEPEVGELRRRIGNELHRRLSEALGPDVHPTVLRTLRFALSGMLIEVGTGHLAYHDLPALLHEVAHIALRGERS